jgi:hypothetical protein
VLGEGAAAGGGGATADDDVGGGSGVEGALDGMGAFSGGGCAGVACAASVRQTNIVPAIPKIPDARMAERRAV